MKKTLLISGILFAGIALLGSCSSSDGPEKGLSPVLSKAYQVKSPCQISLTSATLSKSFSSSPKFYKMWDGDFPTDFKPYIPNDVTAQEKTDIINELRNLPADYKSADFEYTDYFIQNVGASYDVYTTTPDQNGYPKTVTGSNHMDYLVINNVHINDYNASNGPKELVLNLPLVNATYHDSWGDKDNTKADSYIIYYSPTYNAYYLCFDYKTAKNSRETFAGDGVYNDWVIKLTPVVEPTEDNLFEALQDDFRIVKASDETLEAVAYESEGIALSVNGGHIILDATNFTGEDGAYELKIPFSAKEDAEINELTAKMEQLILSWSSNTFFGMNDVETAEGGAKRLVDEDGNNLYQRTDIVSNVPIDTEFKFGNGYNITSANTYIRVSIPIYKGKKYDIKFK